MKKNFSPHRQKNPSRRAQAIVEFAIVLPILLVILVGILEAGRLIFMYAAVNNASREAVRYASAVGLNNAGTAAKYNDCDGIREMAHRSAFFVPLTITISHDTGPGTTSNQYCTGSIGTLSISSGDRVIVQVQADYRPMVNLIPFPDRTIANGNPIESTSARTVLGILKLASDPGVGATGIAGSVSTVTATATRTTTPSTNTPGPTSTATRTATPGPSVSTLTPIPSPTITLLPVDTPTFGPSPTPTDTLTPTMTLTPTETLTPTATFTPTSTSTPTLLCSITAGQLDMSASSPFITLTLTNPYVDVPVSSVYLKWNAATGAPGGKPLTWTAAILAGTSWSVINSSGEYTSVPSTTVMLPGYNVTSTLTIAFNNNYKFPLLNSGTTVTVNFADTNCASITRTK